MLARAVLCVAAQEALVYPQLRSMGPETLLRASKHASLLLAQDEVKLAVQAQEGSGEAFEALLRAHLRLVLTIAREFASYGLPVDDLVSEGLLGLVQAARRFDPTRNVRLAAYAAWWIRAYMRRYTIANRRIVRMPSSRHGRKLLANLRRTQRELTQVHGEPPDAETVAKVLGVPIRDLHEMEGALSGRDIACGSDFENRALELRSEWPSPETQLADSEQRNRSVASLQRALRCLNTRERQIVEQRCLKDPTPSLAAIGRDLGLSRERVRQIERRAHTKLRQALSVA
jgi:RNA polymerase sigma-32 factor